MSHCPILTRLNGERGEKGAGGEVGVRTVMIKCESTTHLENSGTSWWTCDLRHTHINIHEYSTHCLLQCLLSLTHWSDMHTQGWISHHTSPTATFSYIHWFIIWYFHQLDIYVSCHLKDLASCLAYRFAILKCLKYVCNFTFSLI